MRQLTTALMAVGALAMLGAASASGDSTTKCFGKQATIVSSGTINGTEGNDVIVGSEGPDIINAFGGNDLVCALGGNDLIRGGLGDDSLDGGEGNDLIAADVVGDLSPGFDQPAGNDVIIGGPGNDGATGDHRSIFVDVTGDSGDDLFIGGPGNDSLSWRQHRVPRHGLRPRRRRSIPPR